MVTFKFSKKELLPYGVTDMTVEDAEQAGLTIMNEIKETDLSVQKEDLKFLIPEKEQETISKIINAP